ncbi:MAG: serine/threonine-protein kinase [Thermoanaerobaculia bacterium]
MVAERIPGYSLLERLGEGGMGQVWRARRLEDGADVAVKLLPAALHDDRTVRGLFLREAILLSTLRHPNVCRLVDSGETEGGRFFFATELVRGRTVAQALIRGALPVRRALDVAAQTARALEAAHDRSIVHRDIKPANIMLAGDRVKVLDFGVAHLLSADDVGCAGTVYGTTAYAAPEHLAGLECDHRADLWSLGVVLWEMLTAQAPFAGGDPARVAQRVLDHDVPALADRYEGFTDGGPFVAVDGVLRRTLVKDPERRFPTAGEAAVALERALEGLPPDAPERLIERPEPEAGSGGGTTPARAGVLGRLVGWLRR